MTAKAKAVQMLIAVSISAVAITVYTNHSGKTEKQVAAPSLKKTEVKADQKTGKMNAKSAGQNTAVYKESAVPGYSNPNETAGVLDQ